MTGVLMLESLTRGNTLKQGDKTPLTYKLLDADGDNLNVAGKTAVARLVHPNYLSIGYEKSGLLVSQDDTVTFTIDNVIPARKYNVEIIVDNKFVFPSRSVESKFTIDKSTLGTEASIIEIVGVDAVVRKAVDLINEDPSLIIDEDKLINEIIANTSVGSIEEYYQEYRDLITELTEARDFDSAPEITVARGGHETLGDRLDETTAKLAQTEREVSMRGFNLSNLVGEDRIITNAMFIEANASGKNIIYLEKGVYYIHETIRVGHRTLEGNNSTIVAKNCDAFHADNGDWIEIVPRIQNLTLRYEGSGKHKGIIVSRGWWGGRGRLDNIRISDFSIGVLGMGMYHSTLKDIWITGADIGMVIKDNLEISNMNDVSQIDFRDCTYGMYLHEAESMRVFSATFQECVYGLVIGDARYNVEFDNCYYELNEHNTAIGTIDLETFVLSEYPLTVGGVFGSGVNFNKATLNALSNPPYFFGETHKFMSNYGNYDTNRYPDNIDSLFTSGIEYENILRDKWSFYGGTETAVTTNGIADTPYGKRYVSQIDGATGTNIRAITSVTTPLVVGRTYMVKAKVWTPEVMRLGFHFVRDNNESIVSMGGFTTVAGGWVEASTMITVRDFPGGIGSTQQVMIKFPSVSGQYKLLITDMMVVDLTAIFGIGETPGHYLSKSIAKYFNWAPNGERMKIGYTSPQGVLNEATGTRLKYWAGSQAEYDAIETYDLETVYDIW